MKTPYCSQAKRVDPRVPKSINPGMGIFNPKKWSLMNRRKRMKGQHRPVQKGVFLP